MSYLSPLTGLDENLLQNFGIPLADALGEIGVPCIVMTFVLAVTHRTARAAWAPVTEGHLHPTCKPSRQGHTSPPAPLRSPTPTNAAQERNPRGAEHPERRQLAEAAGGDGLCRHD